MLSIMNIVLVLFKCVLVRGTLVWSKLVRNPAYSIHPFTPAYTALTQMP